MGSALGPIFVNAFLYHFEQDWLQTCPLEFKSKVYRQYVDNSPVLFKNKEELTLLVNYMYSKQSNMKFTFDFESNGRMVP